MKRIIFFFLIATGGIANSVFATYFDTGWIEFRQPDGTLFIGRLQGDEYRYQFKTLDGFSFDKNFSDGYYYYAKGVDSKGYVLSHLRVGIDNPTDIPKNLIVVTSEKRLLNEYSPSDKELAKTQISSITLKVVLIEFADVAGDPKYTKSDFENMLSGSEYWQSPDGETTFGSMAYYYNRMSNGNLSITATVLNNTTADGKPIWVTLPHNKSEYRNYAYGFWTDATSAAEAEGYDLSTGPATKLAFIYAGNFYLNGLNPAAQPWNNRYRMCEKWGGRGHYDHEDPSYTFSHIGIHCHEFGHLLGFKDLYRGDHPIIDWCLMADGCDMGYYKGACPAPINPHYRYWKNWIGVSSPTIPNSGIDFPYNEVAPTVYMVESGNDRYYVENRRYLNFSAFLPGHNDGPGGILVWHTYGTHKIDLIEADGTGYTDEGYGDVYPGLTNNRNLNDFTSPNCKRFYSAGNSNVILHNVSNPASTMTATFGGRWFGEVPIDLIWTGTVLIGGDLTVPNDIILTIGPGTIVKFAPDTWLSVYGTLEAVGTSSDRITFTRSGTSNWEGIYLQSNTDDSRIWYADIDHASQGLHIGCCTANIHHTKIHHCDNAFFCAFAHPHFSYNDIYQTGGDGIFAYGSIITMNQSHYNVITQNAGCGVQGTGSTTVFADYGGNSIYNNFSREMRMTSGSVAYAEYNWWGSDPPDSNEFEGPVDYDPWLGSNPNPGRPKPLVVASLDEKVKQAHELLCAGMHEEAIRLADAVIEESPNSLAAFSALNIIRFAHWESEKPGFDSYVLGLAAQHNHEQMGGVALLNYAAELVRRGDYERALTTLEGLRRDRSGSDFEKLALFTELLVYQVELGDTREAHRVFSILKSCYPNDLLTDLAERLLNIHRSPRPKKPREERKEPLPETFSLSQNYPNPGNPSTTITFTLPTTTHIILAIYNLLGQRVRTLVEGVKEAGSHTAVWDGRDESGKVVSNGVYLYRLKADLVGQRDFVRVKKMLLIR